MGITGMSMALSMVHHLHSFY